MATPNILSDLSNVIIKPAINHYTLSSAGPYAQNLLGNSNDVVPADKVVKVVNLMVSVGNAITLANDGVSIDIALYNGSTFVADLFTDYVIYRYNTVCLIDEATPLILEEGYTLKGNSSNSSYCNFYMAYEVIENA